MSLENITDRCFWNGLNTSFHSGNTNCIGGKGDCFCPNLANGTNAKTGFRKLRAVIQTVPLKCMKKFHLLLDTVEWRSHEMNAWIFTFTYRQSSSNRRGSTQACGSTWCMWQHLVLATNRSPANNTHTSEETMLYCVACDHLLWRWLRDPSCCTHQRAHFYEQYVWTLTYYFTCCKSVQRII